MSKANHKKHIIIKECPGHIKKSIKQIEEPGKDVVVFENYTGTKKLKNNMSTQGNLVENIAKRYLKTPLFCNVQKRHNI